MPNRNTATGGNNPSNGESGPTAPSYLELFNAVASLTTQFQQLQSTVASRQSSPTPSATSAPTSSVDYRILPDVGTSIWSFTGHESSSRAEDWISSVDALAQISQWPLQHRLLYVRSYVTEAARSWFLLEEFSDWTAFVQSFRRTFVRTLRKADLWRELESRVQGPNEPTIDYFYAKIGLCRSLDLSFLDTREYVLEGLRSQPLTDWVYCRQHTTREDLLSDIQDWERMRAKRKEKFESLNSSTNKSRLAKQKSADDPIRSNTSSATTIASPKVTTGATAKPHTSSSASTSSSTKDRPLVYCYNCRGAGHISKDCPKPRRPVKCSNCHSDQHTRGRCPTADSDRTDTASTADQAYRADATTVSANQTNPFIKTVYVNGQAVNGLIDTGSSAVLIRSSIARACGLVIRNTVCPLYTVGNAVEPSTMTIGEGDADVIIDDVLAADHPLKVVSDHSLPVDVLVGRTWLNLPHVNYFKQGGELVFETNSCVSPDALADTHAEDIYIAETEPVRPAKEPITADDVVIDTDVTEIQRESLVTLLNEHRDVFAKNIMELGCTNVISMDIAETPGSAPFRQKPYRTSPTDRRTIADTLRDWREAGIISDSTSSYASPVLLVNKSSGEKRLCVDYRRLNKQTETQPYPMPDVDSQLAALSRGVIFTTLDLSNGFLQIPLTPAAKEKTAFVTEEATAKFERMPFGLKGAPGTFQKLMGVVFEELKTEGVVSTYLDDIILPSENWERMMNDLRRVLSALRAANLTLKPSKCTFGARELDYLGFRISEGTVKPGRKVLAIAKFPRPNNAHEVRRFLGLAGYFRRFIVKYALIAAPLTRLTSKDAPFNWSQEQEDAFVALREALVNEPVVKMYDPNAPVTEVHTDASSHALSGILLQGSTTTSLHMVYAVSKKTTTAESKYHSSHLELYAIIWTLNRLRQFLLGIQFVVYTDCQALVYLNIHKTSKPQIARWFEILNEFDFIIKYRPGSRMAHVDALSRAIDDERDPTSVDAEVTERLEVCVALTKEERVRFMQQVDENSRKLIMLLECDGKLTKSEQNEIKDYELSSGVLYRRYKGRSLLVIPKSMRKGIVIEAHDHGGHFSTDRTVARITTDYWFSCLRRYVRQHINMCIDCLTHKRPAGKRPGLLNPILPGKRPFQIVHVDHLGPFETTYSNNKYLLVLADNLTKFVHLYPCRTTDAAGVIRILKKFCDERGIPDRIISDRGTCFTSKPFQEFCRNREISHTLNSTRHPQANGQVERVNRTLLPLLSMSTADQRRWDTHVKDVERMLNTAVNKTTTKTPYEALHGYLPRYRPSALSTLSRTRNESQPPAEVQAEIRENILRGQAKMKDQYDRRHYEGVRYEVGEVVVMLKQPKAGQPTKLQAKYREKPLQIMKVLPSDTYRVAELGTDGHETFATTAHVSQLKSWRILREDDDEVSPEDGDDDESLSDDEVQSDTKGMVTEMQPTFDAEPAQRQSTRKRQVPAYLGEYELGRP